MENFPDFARLRALYEEKKEEFSAFSALLLRENAKYNLTSIVEEDEVFHKHFLDSLAAEALFPQNAAVAEVGSGAGFPSIPLMIVRPDLKFTLIESTGKKCKFLQMAKELLGLNAEICCERAEDAGRGEMRERFSVVCARAVAPLNTLAEYCLPLLSVGGRWISYKGEEEHADEAISLLGGGKPDYYSYELPDGYGKRTLIVSEKIKETPSRYPRGNGQERKAPLGARRG